MRALSLGAVLLAGIPCVTAQDLAVRCASGCADPGMNRSLNLLMREDASAPVTIAWESAGDPAAGDHEVLLYAGNPEVQDGIPRRGVLEFRQEGGLWLASRDFQPSDLGRGTFLAIVTMRRRGSEGDKDERILDWRAFRLMTVAEAQARVEGPKPPGAWSITVVPALLRAQSGHGGLPRSQGGDASVWWSLLGSEGNGADLDLDGEYNGLPGLGVQVSTPWQSRSGQDWKEAALEHLTGVEGHHVRFDGLEWMEAPDRTVSLPEAGKVFLRSYYTAITLHTAASMKSLAKDELEGPQWKRTFFSHETSARLKHPADPRFWASYSRREYGADPKLLAMLQDQIERGETVQGLTGLQRDDGDGGTPSYSVGFYAEVRPWEEQEASGEEAKFRAGIVGVDVVAARAGVGGLASRGSAGAGALGQIWCKVVGCGEDRKTLDLDSPPSGYTVTSAGSSLGTVSGNLPLIDGSPEIAERAPINLPSRARFGVTANLRSGALLSETWTGRVKDVIPIDAYAQFIVKITVAMLPETNMVANTDMTVATQLQFEREINAPKPKMSRLGFALLLLGIVGVPLLVLLLVPGGIGLIRAVLGLIVKALRALVDAVSGWLDRRRRSTG
ncbi:MAG: hypothetical protein ACREAA_02000 [Candidatus Polarisedimenticolia bacterium]